MATTENAESGFGGRAVSDMDILELTGAGSLMGKAPTPHHTLMIVVGAVAILWVLGSVTFKGIRQ